VKSVSAVVSSNLKQTLKESLHRPSASFLQQAVVRPEPVEGSLLILSVVTFGYTQESLVEP